MYHAHRLDLWSFLWAFFICQIGGVERGESAGPGTDDRSIRERHTALFDHVLRRERNRGHEERKPVRLELCPLLYI